MPLAVTKEETKLRSNPALAAQRAETAERTKRDRLDAAVRVLDECGLKPAASAIVAAAGSWEIAREAMSDAKVAVQSLRARLADGTDEARYAATGVALEALGRLWAVS